MDEYISRKEVCKICANNKEYCGKEKCPVYKAPAVDIQKHGRWLPQRLLGQPVVDCSECKTLGSPHWKWCPLCGARMDGEDDG